jgi:hypothetical protein
VELLLNDPRIDPTTYEQSALLDAATNGHVDIVRHLLKDPRVDPTIDNNQVLISASEQGHADIVSLLLTIPSVNPNARDDRAFHLAVENAHTRVVERLLPRVDMNSKYHSLMYSIQRITFNTTHRDIIGLFLSDHRVSPLDSEIVKHQIITDVGLLRFCLKNENFDPTCQDNVLLRKIVQCDWLPVKERLEVLKELLKDPRVDPSFQDKFLLRWTLNSGRKEILQALRDHESCVIDSIGISYVKSMR